MNHLLELLTRYCQLTNIQPVVDPEGNLELYPVFLEANKQGLLSSKQLKLIEHVLREDF